VLVRGRLVPLDDARNPGEAGERSVESEHGITARIESARILSVDPRVPFTYDAQLAHLHAIALATLRARLAEPGASIVAGELWGERTSLSPELRAEFSETGTVHVLITAGLHVGLVAVVALALAQWFGASRVAACAVALLVVWIFAAFSGLEIPALRAATMATVALAARACGRVALSWHTLAIAACVVLAANPQGIAGASFWLSFCCVGAIFACARPIESCLEPLALDRHVREALVLTLSTQLGTWPITAAVFLQFSPYAVLANLAVVPCVPLTMCLGALQLLSSGIAPLAQGFANLNTWALAWTTGAVHLLASLPNATLPMTPAPTWCIVGYEVALLGASLLLRQEARTAAAALMIVASSLVLAPPHARDYRLRITVLDVGQADAIVIETPLHHAILVDAGGRLERGATGTGSVAEQIGERIVVPFLLRQGIHAVDAIIVSHPHGDHVGGCAPVLRKIRVAEIADSGQTYGGHAYHDCLDTASADHVPVVYPRAGDAWHTNDGVTLTFIGPSLPFIDGKNAINDNSIAFILKYKQFRMLFTGDAGVAAERRFLAEGIDLSAAVLKVGHHGSAYSSSPEFIAAVHPRYAVISVGRNNMFGHPAPSTIDTLERVGAQVYRTDENGATMVTTDGAAESVSNMVRQESAALAPPGLVSPGPGNPFRSRGTYSVHFTISKPTSAG
jgi:competence protein ComEC